MTTSRTILATAIATASLITVGVVGSNQLSSAAPHESGPQMGCEDWSGTYTAGECHAAGIIRFYALNSIQGAVQFCKWRAANPGEWSRLQGYATSNTPPLNIITWMGAAVRQQLEAYFAAGGPTFTIQPNTAPNICGAGKLVKPPVVAGVSPTDTDATVTIETATP
jgi:hypothetical protein